MVPIPKRESHCLRIFFPFKICKEVYGKPKLCSKFRLLSDMKKKRMTKLLAAILSGVLLTSTLPAVSPVSVLAADNLISNSTFSSGTSGWGMYKESGGAATLSTEDGKLALHVTNTGKLTYSVQLNYDIIPLYKNGVYHLSYEISSDTDRYVEGMIQQNGGTYQSYTWKGLNLTSEPQKVDYEFTMKADTDIMSKWCSTAETRARNWANTPSIWTTWFWNWWTTVRWTIPRFVPMNRPLSSIRWAIAPMRKRWQCSVVLLTKRNSL